MKQETNQTVNRALHLLDFFADCEELGVSELSVLMDVDKTSVLRLINSLTNAGFLQKNDQTKKYRLGLKLLFFGRLVEERNELAISARPFMKQISDKYQATTLLTILDNNQTRIIQKISAGPFVYMAAQIGLLLPAYAMASGKLLLANSGEENIRSYLTSVPLTAMTGNTITDPEKLEEEFRTIRLRGFAKDSGESTLGLSCLAVPVYGPHRKVIAALSVSGQSEVINLAESSILQDLQNSTVNLGACLK